MKLYGIQCKNVGGSYQINHDYCSEGDTIIVKLSAESFEEALKKFKELVIGEIEILGIVFLFNC